MADTYGALVEETEGWKDLVAWIEAEVPEGEPKRNTSQLAKMLKKSQPAVRGWLERHSRPTEGPLRDALCRIIGSHPDRWRTKKEIAEAKRLAAIGAEPRDEERTGDVA